MVCYHFEKSAVTTCRWHKSYTALQFKRSLIPHISTMLRQSYRQPVNIECSYNHTDRAVNIECWSAVESGSDSTTAHVVNIVKILRNSILLVTFHHIVLVYYHYSSCAHQSGLENGEFILHFSTHFLVQCNYVRHFCHKNYVALWEMVSRLLY